MALDDLFNDDNLGDLEEPDTPAGGPPQTPSLAEGVWADLLVVKNWNDLRDPTLKQRRARLAGCLEQAYKELCEAKTESGNLRGQLQSAQTEAENIRTQLDAAREEDENLRSQLNAAQAETAGLRSRLAEAESKAQDPKDLEALKLKLLGSSAEAERYKAESETATNELITARAALRKADLDAKLDKATIKQLQAQIVELSKKVNALSLVPVSSTTDQQFRELQAKHAALEGRYKDLQERYDKLLAISSTPDKRLTDQLNELKRENNELKSENNALKRKGSEQQDTGKKTGGGFIAPLPATGASNA